MTTQKDELLDWLNDAYAMENGLVTVLRQHAKQAESQSDIASRLEGHADVTQRHADMVRGCIESLGGSVSALKTGIAEVMGVVKGASTVLASDNLVKNTLADIATEHFEIACYTSLIAGAQHVGATDVVEVCSRILAEEQAMAGWLEANIGQITVVYLQSVSPSSASATA